MPARRGLITDTFKVVKKAKTEDSERKKSPPPPEPVPESPQLSERERDLLELKKFDLDWRFGPCTGISRLQRWDRAAQHGLDPPQDIKDLLLSKESDPEFSYCLWRDYPL